MKLEFYQDDSGEHRWRVKAKNGEIVAASTEAFASEENCKANYHLNRCLPSPFSGEIEGGRAHTIEEEVKANKELRQVLDHELQHLKNLPGSRERSLAITKLQEGIMWLGMDLKRLNEPNPYPESKNPLNTQIEPTADGLSL